MRPARIRWGMLGGGAGSLIGIVHRIAAGMGDDYRLVGGVFSSDPAASIEFARDLELAPQRAYSDVDALIAGESALPSADRMRLVTIATPNYLHYEAARKLVSAGFHVLCEKPVTTSVAQANEIERLVQSSGVIFAVAHTYTGYPMVRQLRSMVAAGLIGAVQKVHVQYYQGWINPLLRLSFETIRSGQLALCALDSASGAVQCSYALALVVSVMFATQWLLSPTHVIMLSAVFRLIIIALLAGAGAAVGIRPRRSQARRDVGSPFCRISPYCGK